MLCQVQEEAAAEAADSEEAAEAPEVPEWAGVREVPEWVGDPGVPEWEEVPEVPLLPLPLAVGVPVGAVRADIGAVAQWS